MTDPQPPQSDDPYRQASELTAALLRLSCSLAPGTATSSPAGDVQSLMRSEFELHDMIDDALARATIVRLTTAVTLLAASRARTLADQGIEATLDDVIELVIALLEHADR